MRIQILTIACAVILLLGGQTTFAKKKQKKEVNFFNAPYDTKISMKSFHQHMRESFGELLCDKGGHFTSCYKVSAKKCQREVNKQYNQCAKAYKKQKTIRVYKTGVVAGHNLGLCIGQKFHQKYRDKFKRSPACE